MCSWEAPLAAEWRLGRRCAEGVGAAGRDREQWNRWDKMYGDCRAPRPGYGEGARTVLGKPKRLGQIKKCLGRTALGKWIEGTGWKRMWWGVGGQLPPGMQLGHDLRKDKLKEAAVRERISGWRQGQQRTEVTPVWLWNGTPSIPHPPSVSPLLLRPSRGSSSVQPPITHPSVPLVSECLLHSGLLDCTRAPETHPPCPALRELTHRGRQPCKQAPAE